MVRFKRTVNENTVLLLGISGGQDSFSQEKCIRVSKGTTFLKYEEGRKGRGRYEQ